jgi:LAGLIDADG DNA endonuclease family
MDDGGKLDYNINSKNKSIVLNTHSFSYDEVTTMSKELDVKFNLNCEVRSNKSKNIIVIKDYDTFISLTNLHILEEMKYKLPK